MFQLKLQQMSADSLVNSMIEMNGVQPTVFGPMEWTLYKYFFENWKDAKLGSTYFLVTMVFF